MSGRGGTVGSSDMSRKELVQYIHTNFFDSPEHKLEQQALQQ